MEEGENIKESEIQFTVFSPDLPGKLKKLNSDQRREGQEGRRDSPATELGRGMRYRGMEWAEWEDMLSRLRSGILLRL